MQGGGASETAHFGIRDSEDELVEAGHYAGSGTHWTRFLGHVEPRSVESPVADFPGGLSDGEDLGMGGRVVKDLNLVPCAGDDAFLKDEDSAYRDLIGFPSLEGFIEGKRHVVAIVPDQFRGPNGLKGAGGRRSGFHYPNDVCFQDLACNPLMRKRG